MFEVNLVPDVKAELLKAQKTRNFIIYICILVAAICIGIIAVLGSIAGGQGLVLASQDNEMKEKSDCILLGQNPTSGYLNNCATLSSNLNLNLTIQDQLGKLSDIGSKRRLLSRVFGILDVILPTGDDTVTISELAINLPLSTISFDGQADSASDIDYRALEVFKKTVELSYYDYGNYIDEDGAEIPSFCVDEILENNIIYGVYHKGATGCGEVTPTEEETPTDTGEETDPTDTEQTTPTESEESDPVETPTTPTIEDIRIKRAMTATELETAMSSNAPYFQSECISEDGTNECLLVDDPVLIRESSNGRNSAGSLVLRFSATVTINSDVFAFVNKHMRVISPTRQNVTDSYVQVRNMFTEEATECAANDLECINAGGGN